jgi:hypothetical protein
LETVVALQQGDAEATSELKIVTQLIRETVAAPAAVAAAAAAPPRKKLIIKEVDEDEDEEPAATAASAPRHVDPTATVASAKHEDQEEARKREEQAKLAQARQERINRDISNLADQQKLEQEQRRQQGVKEEQEKQRQRRANPRVEEVEDEPEPPVPQATTAASSSTSASLSSQPRASSANVPTVKVQAWTKDKLKTPKNFSEFERVYADIRADAELFDAYLLLIAPATYKSVFGSSLTPEMLVDLLEAAKRSTAVRAKEILEGLVVVNRLDELVMFFEAKEKALVAEVFSLVSNSGAPKAAIDKLRLKFS